VPLASLVPSKWPPAKLLYETALIQDPYPDSVLRLGRKALEPKIERQFLLADGGGHLHVDDSRLGRRADEVDIAT
jgi:hypothetical protein